MKIQKAIGVRVIQSDAETVRRFLLNKGVLRSDLRVKRDGEFVIFPIMRVIGIKMDCEVGTFGFISRSGRIISYKDLVDIPRDFMGFLPTSFDVVGSIIMLKLPKEVMGFKREIGSALLQAHPQCATVCLVDPVQGEFRVRDVEVIAGVKSTETVHREFGLFFKVDVGKVYFSPRLASERHRVANLVERGEVVVDMFSSVGPFAVMIARYSFPKRVYAIDKNRDAAGLAEWNVVRNKVQNCVEVVCADADNIKYVLGAVRGDRIIMNLPFGGFDFVSKALSIANERCVVHYYEIMREEMVEVRIEELKGVAENLGFSVGDVDVHRIKSYAPYEFYMGFDIVAQKVADVA
ncbi:MAG: class I SAM-dependent methyltransferase family protein [Candidatus Thermoplasmatota archaeon]|nr:class I SAM-dependent methyltransferase family protein [Candidatus Thermoplasmatota archaeon]MBU1941555.1 class I SAM-dependent methyltransferase family protein [Candidatus Thermoplasmatota archaeon]